ncbi:MAG: ethanolamine utilization protein EutH [Ignavibacteriae bacterium HGW-Ignavibacteriae-2]|nr:ethanolamine utilization protein EutH [Bacteroidota bacterium]PKL88314.1 MAG: ethanolamine utilization protein EutH [Ignavibacteriae bacterium HGW-Ignavibacteriae-2]
MEIINEIIVFAMMVFMLIGGLDRILDQFGGSVSVLSKIKLGFFGKSIEGVGKEFEEGFNSWGALSLAMVGVIALAPVLAYILSPIIVPVFSALGASPAMFATSILANDMGGYFLAKELVTQNGVVTDYASWMYAGLILGSMMGPTIVFTIPVGLGIIDLKDRPVLALGILAGIVAIPLGCIAGGLVAVNSTILTPEGAPIIFTYGIVFKNLIPIIIFSAIISLGLWKIPDLMIKGFMVFAKILVALITVGLVAIVWESLTGMALIPGLDPILPIPGDIPTIDIRALEVIGRIALVLAGAYPMVFLVSRWFKKPLTKLGTKLGVSEISAIGFIATLANCIPMFKILNKMDDRGKVLNIAFAVSAAFTLGDHLGFTAAVKPDMIFPVIVGKLTGGITAILIAMLIVKNMKTNDSYQVTNETPVN